MSEKDHSRPGSRLASNSDGTRVDSLLFKADQHVGGATASPHPADWDGVGRRIRGRIIRAIATAGVMEDGAEDHSSASPQAIT